MSKASESVKRWRKNTKERLVSALGGKCVICGYNKCSDALEFHHKDPSQKDFNLGAARGSIKNWNSLVLEAKKCLLLCSNCHREVHASMIDVSSIEIFFDIKFIEYKSLKKQEIKKQEISEIPSVCSICGAKKRKSAKTCSIKCRSVKISKVDWSLFDLKEMKKKMSTLAISKLIGVSDNAVRKRMKKLNII